MALVRQAIEQSKTFGGLVDTINASDGFVYVEEGRCGHGVRSCFVTVTVAGGHRILWVYVDTQKRDWDLMGSIGHELRHTVEVLGSPSVTSRNTMYAFYHRLGTYGTDEAFETVAAVDAGEAVRTEVRTYRARVTAK